MSGCNLKLTTENCQPLTNHQSLLTDPAVVAVVAVPGAEVEVRGVDSHAVAVVVVFSAGSVPRALAKLRASSETPGLTRTLTAQGMRPVSAIPLVTEQETLLPKAMQPAKRMLLVRQTLLGWEKPIAKQSPKAREMPSAKAHLLLPIRPKGQLEGHRRRQWLS